MLTSKEIRESFLKFFENKNHKRVPSAPVVPFEDPTLLFTNAGMNQFKDVFLGKGRREYSRAVDTQKCIRAGGKHNDLEDVGMDGRHHTFFEMLGNWSFGDYYKSEAIKWAWELLTEVWKLPKDKLWATVHHTDDEAKKYWETNTDIDKSHILIFGDKDNFWEMGQTGPCGPCSEIHYDFTENGCDEKDVNSDNDSVIEIWNLVFIQYNRDENGELHPLPQRHVDTGMGLERIVRVIQGKGNNYEIDIFTDIIDEIKSLTGKEYTGDNIPVFNTIADHIRCLCFAIADGAIPSNEGRGYVLRRILRRASRLGRKLGYGKPLLYLLVDKVGEIYNDIFPELSEKSELLKEVILSEEKSFHATLDKGLELFNQVCEKLSKSGEKIFPGDKAFKLYDTYGFPIDLTQIISREKGLIVDMDKFNEEMEIQKDRARNARKNDSVQIDLDRVSLEKEIEGLELTYNPYHSKNETLEVEIVKVINDFENGTSIVIFKNNPLYAEGGGQISDLGVLKAGNYSLPVINVADKFFVYVKNDNKNVIPLGKASVKFDIERRHLIQKNHSATHLLHQALQIVLGGHIKQMGSLVTDEYLRFDFPHFKKVEKSELSQIEKIVNMKIKDSSDVQVLTDVPISEAQKIPNVKMFFGETYGSEVRVVKMGGDFSAELCGGTHVSNTSDIGFFIITKEESVSSGVRRIFAKTGTGALNHLKEAFEKYGKELSTLPGKYTDKIHDKLISLKNKFYNASHSDVETFETITESLREMSTEIHELKKQYEEEKKSEAKKAFKESLQNTFKLIDEMVSGAKDFEGFKILYSKLDLSSNEELMEVGERLQAKLRNGIGLIAAVINGKINLVCSVSENLIKEKKLHAGKIAGAVAKELGGGGGGKPNLASAGAKDVNRLDEVLGNFENILKNFIS
ncbi:MAG TPA: alanine--tRNA ligase [Ignavibacteria bacterium]|nr:alanine--tRNA ligase [Ignavibacteria bacterium]